MINILVVEDNEKLRKLVNINLSHAGYNVFEAENGIEALKVIDENNIHLMIVDIMMPEMDGYELTKELREAKIFIPILIVTAKESLEDKRMGFGLGADDYMVKPIDMEEMLLRIEALLRRSNINSEKKLVMGSTEINEESYTVTVNGNSMSIPQKEFGILYLLLSYPGKIFTRQAIMDEIWGYETETDPRTVDVHIKRLREKFSDNPDFEIDTVRGLGYRIIK
ncbi:MAG: response regulator transcription factor [Lachnospiraceae bacterium]